MRDEYFVEGQIQDMGLLLGIMSITKFIRYFLLFVHFEGILPDFAGAVIVVVLVQLGIVLVLALNVLKHVVVEVAHQLNSPIYILVLQQENSFFFVYLDLVVEILLQEWPVQHLELFQVIPN